MAVRWYSVVIDCLDVAAQARWWAAALDWAIAYEADDEVVIVPKAALDPANQPPPGGDGPGPGLVFVSTPDGKAVKNRVHIDLAPWAGDDQAAEVDRLLGLGARRVDIGQGEKPWVVLADPEGNELCVLTPRD